MGQGGLGRDPLAGVILQELLRRKDNRLTLGQERSSLTDPTQSLRGCLNPELCEVTASELCVCLCASVCVRMCTWVLPHGGPRHQVPGPGVTVGYEPPGVLLGTDSARPAITLARRQVSVVCLHCMCQGSWPVNSSDPPVSGPHPALGALGF